MTDNDQESRTVHSLCKSDWNAEWSVLIQNTLESSAARLDEYMDRLFWWNAKVNLVSRDVSRETLSVHVRHSAALLRFLSPYVTIVDVGTGGGLPGMVLAILNPDARVVLNDRQQKKCRVLKEMSRSLSCDNVEVVECDLQKMIYPEPCQVVSRHAFKLEALFTAVSDVKWERIAVLKGIEDIPQEWRLVPRNIMQAMKERAEILDGCAGRYYSLESLGSDPYWDGKGVLELSAQRDVRITNRLLS